MAQDSGILTGEFQRCLTEGVRESLFLCPKSMPVHRVEFSHPMELGGVILCRLKSVPLVGHRMDKHRLIHFLCRAEHLKQFRQVMSIHGAEVIQSHVLKHRTPQQLVLQPFLHPVGKLVDGVPSRDMGCRIAVEFLEVGVALLGADLRQVHRHAPHIGIDGHLIVVENDHHGFAAAPHIIQPLVSHAASGSTITD